METLIRCHILSHLIWVCTVCLCPQNRTLGLNGLIDNYSHFIQYMDCFKIWISQFYISWHQFYDSLVLLTHIFIYKRPLTLKAPITNAADDKFCNIFPNFRKKIRYDVSWESSASRRFSWNIIPYMLFLKMQQNLKLTSAAKGRFKGLTTSCGFWSSDWLDKRVYT